MHIRRSCSLALIILAATAACSTDRGPTTPTPLVVPAPVLLKDMVLSNLPSPYYHFDYDANGRVTAASFASGFSTYDLVYDGSRLTEMRNNGVGNRDRLTYAYDAAGRVSLVSYTDSSGSTYARVRLTYDGQRLVGLLRQRLMGAGFIPDKEMVFSYDNDGHLSAVEEHRHAIAGFQDETTVVDAYEMYDVGINVDGFSLIHDDFFDNLVLLPQLQLQRNNPRRQTHTGDGDNFVVDYSYEYDDKGRPLTKAGFLTFTSGPDAGQRFQIGTVFSYY
ncbi:MAG TPA: hypothetical protein VH277_12925 [Gemmatimonadaceae bacterium]|jgi:hypothetical protein|nr:hypothetical protein [Gemmatimonadaceae bacterium]